MSSNKKEPKTYYIRMSEKVDIDRIVEFYKKNQHSNVRQRDLDILKERANHGSIVIIEDEDKNIVAASISYSHTVEENGVESVKWVEVGSTRIAGLNGFPGVFDLMTTTQILRSYLVEPPENCFVAHMEHDVIQNLAERLGWRKIDDSKDIQNASDKTINNTDIKDRSDDWYRFGVEGLPIMAKYMVDAWKKPVLTNEKTGEKIKISFEKSSLIKKFKYNIENLSKQDYGSVDKPDLSKGIRRHRDNWLIRRFR